MVLCIRSALILFLILILVPYLIGLLWTKYVKDIHLQKSASLAFVMGFITMLVLFQLQAVPMIVLRQSFKTLEKMWLIEIIILSLFSMLINFNRLTKGILGWKKEVVLKLQMPRFEKLLCIILVSLVCIQAALLSHADLYDTDDARYIAEGLDAIRTDSMLSVNPITGEDILSPIGEMLKDVMSPFMFMEAIIADISEVHLSTLCHVVFPLLLIPLCYSVYWLLGIQIFGISMREKRFLFLIFICFIMMFGKLSAYWDSAYLLWRIWQGKAILQAIILPFIIWIMLRIMEDNKQCTNYLILLFTMCASCSLSLMGIVFPAVIVGIYNVLICLYKKSINGFWRVLICCSPIIIYGFLTIQVMRYFK